jgi:hypothetical protein
MVFAYAAVSAAQKPRHPKEPSVPRGRGMVYSHTATFTGSIRRKERRYSL